jgi:tetrahydromethanopterin S-methyltransferase subunit B
MNLIYQNTKPIMFVVLMSIIGFFCGNALIGFLIGVGIVAAVTLIF